MQSVDGYSSWLDTDMSDRQFYSDKSDFKRQILDGYLFITDRCEFQITSWREDGTDLPLKDKAATATRHANKIAIFGAGKGARRARALCGMLHKVRH